MYAKYRENEQFWSIWPPSANLTFPTLKNYLQIESTKYIFRHVIYVIPKKLHAKKEKKVTEVFLRLTPPPLNIDGQTDRLTDDRQLGIRKATLPLVWRS